MTAPCTVTLDDREAEAAHKRNAARVQHPAPKN